MPLLDISTAVPIVKRKDGFYQKDEFDLSTAMPYDPAVDTQEDADIKGFINPPPSDEEVAKKQEEIVTDWILSKKKELGVVKAAGMTYLTGGLYPIIEGVSGAIQNKDSKILDRVTNGILYPEQTKSFWKNFTDYSKLPQWAQTIGDVSEGIVKYGVAGLVKAGAETKLLSRSLARDVNRAADMMTEEAVGKMAKGEGVIAGQEATFAKKLSETKAKFVDVIMRKLSFRDVSTLKTGFQEAAERKTLIGMIGEELDAMGVTSGISRMRNQTGSLQIGQTVQFPSEGKILSGKITEILGQRLTVDVAGKSVIATIPQLQKFIPQETNKARLPSVEGVSGSSKKALPVNFEREGDAVGREYHETIYATDQKTNERLGYVQYSYLNGESSIRMIEVKPEYRRKNIATQLLNLVQSESKKPINILGDYKTKEGNELFKTWQAAQGGKTPPPTKPTAVSPGPEELPEGKPMKAGEVKPTVRQTTGQVKGGEPIIDERTALRETLKAQVKAAATAEKVTREQIYDIQSNMIDVINQSDLEPADKAKFITTIKNSNTPKQFVKLLPSVEEKIGFLEEKAVKKELISEIKKIITKSAESDAIAVDYRNAIEKVILEYDIKERNVETLNKLQDLRDFIAKQKAKGIDVELPKKVLAKLDILAKKPLNRPISELQALRDDLQNLVTMGKTKQRAKEAVYKAKKEKMKADLLTDAAAINAKQVPKVPIGDTPNKVAERYIGLLNHIIKTKTGLTPIEGLADVTGMQKMKSELDIKFGEYLTFNDDNYKKWYDITKDFDEGNLKRIGAIAMKNQEGGIERLANSGITEDELNAIILTPAEQAAYDFVRTTFDSLYPDVKKFSQDVYNEDVGKIENYVSFMSDYEQMSDLEMYDRFGTRPQEEVTRRTKNVESGFTKERSDKALTKLELNIDKIFRRHLDDVGYMLTMGKDIKMYYEIVNSTEMREALGDVGTLAWLQWLDLMARKGGSEGAKRIAAIDTLRRNMGAGVLGFRLSSVLVQLSSFGDTMATIGAEWATKGASAITNKEWRDFIMDNFPEVKKAVGDDVAFREFGEDFLGKMTRIGMTPLQMLDGLMRSTASAGTYIKLCAEKGVPVDLQNPDPKIIAEATKIMRQSQGSSFFKDQPLSLTTGFGLLENRSLNKMVLTFQSFMLGRWDNLNRQIWRLGIKEKNYKKAIMSAFWMLTFGFAGEEVLRRTTKKITGIGAKKKKKKDEPSFAQSVAGNVVSAVPLVGQLASSIAYSSNPVPIISTMENIIEGAATAVTAKDKGSKAKGVIKAIGGIGSLSGVPGSAQAAQLIQDRIKTKRAGGSSIRD